MFDNIRYTCIDNRYIYLHKLTFNETNNHKYIISFQIFGVNTNRFLTFFTVLLPVETIALSTIYRQNILRTPIFHNII